MSVRLIRGALLFFGVTGALSALLLLAGPAPFIRLLALVALAGSLAGGLVQLYALRTFAPESYAALRARFAPAAPVDHALPRAA